MNEREATWFRVCAYCDTRLPASVRHPVHTVRDHDGFHLYAFCDEVCKSQWLERLNGRD